MNLLEVGYKQKLVNDFLEVPLAIYANYPNWIRPLNQDIEAVFDPKKNRLFRVGSSAVRWVLYNEQEQPIGRIAAFINSKTSEKEAVPTGGIGFFECIENADAAKLLFDIAIDWLKQNKMEAVDGPINFGDRDRWWGLLIDGDFAPNYSCNYNPPYYKALFEGYGFQTYFKQYTYYRSLTKPLEQSVFERAERIKNTPSISFRHLQKSKLKKYTEDFRVVYNKAWVRHGVPEMTKSMAAGVMKKLKPIMDERIIWFGYENEEPVAFMVALPELNQIFKHLNGNLNWLGKLKFLFHKVIGTNNKMLGLVFGIVPEWQGKGMESALIIAVGEKLLNGYVHYSEMEMNWIGDFNPKMMRVAENIGGEIRKVHATYRLFFDGRKVDYHPVI
jgi:hypothetical protein